MTKHKISPGSKPRPPAGPHCTCCHNALADHDFQVRRLFTLGVVRPDDLTGAPVPVLTNLHQALLCHDCDQLFAQAVAKLNQRFGATDASQ